MKTQYGKTGVTTTGVKYKNEYGRLSGSPETSAFNSLQNAFMAYATFREMGKTHEEAWVALGIYGGDDGVTGNVEKQQCEDVAKRLGHKMEAKLVYAGQGGVNFLARVYSPFVWKGDLNSCTDIRRALAKLHVSTNLTVSPEIKLFEKGFALFLTDANTPIIGPFVTRVMELKGDYEFTNKLGRWLPHWQAQANQQYPNADFSGWMTELVRDQGLDVFRQHDMAIWLADCQDLTDLLHSPSFIDTPPVVVPEGKTVEINGELFKGKQPSVETEEPVDMESKYQGPQTAEGITDLDEMIKRYIDKKRGDVPHIISLKPRAPPPSPASDATFTTTTSRGSQPGHPIQAPVSPTRGQVPKTKNGATRKNTSRRGPKGPHGKNTRN